MSKVFRVGVPGRFRGHGEVAVYLDKEVDGPTRVAVNVAYMASETVEISVEQAEELVAHLTELIDLERNGERNHGH